MTDRQFTILCSLITFILSLISSWIIKIYDNNKSRKERKYNEFYKNFILFGIKYIKEGHLILLT